MNNHERCMVIRAMETIIKAVNNTALISQWRVEAIADGDIRPGTLDEDMEYYIEDDVFAALMDTFLRVMNNAKADGGLYVDGIVSKDEEEQQ